MPHLDNCPTYHFPPLKPTSPMGHLVVTGSRSLQPQVFVQAVPSAWDTVPNTLYHLTTFGFPQKHALEPPPSQGPTLHSHHTLILSSELHHTVTISNDHLLPPNSSFPLCSPTSPTTVTSGVVLISVC